MSKHDVGPNGRCYSTLTTHVRIGRLAVGAGVEIKMGGLRVRLSPEEAIELGEWLKQTEREAGR